MFKATFLCFGVGFWLIIPLQAGALSMQHYVFQSAETHHEGCELTASICSVSGPSRQFLIFWAGTQAEVVSSLMNIQLQAA